MVKPLLSQHSAVDSVESVGPFVRWPARLIVASRSALSGQHAMAILIALTLVMSLPILWLHLDSDDYFQVLSLEHQPGIQGVAREPWDLYAYAKSRGVNLALREEGVWPWWANVDVLVAFFRPLSSLTRWLDHVLWPRNVPLMQFHSLLWFGLLLGVVARVYRALVPSAWVASLALLLFAFDEGRVGAVGWLCNRNALVSLVFGFAALAAHHRTRAGERVFGWHGPVWLALGLLGGETALQVAGYLFAYAVCLDRGRPRERALSLLPYAVVLLLWALLYAALGYGARGSGFYIDPLRSPGTYLGILPERLSIYALALFSGVSSDWFNLLPLFGMSPRPYLLPLAALWTLLMVLALTPLFRVDRHVRFWTVGALLATLPACAVSPSDRMLTGSALGGMAALASFFGALADKTYPRPTRWLRVFAVALVMLNVLYPLAVRPKLIDMFDDFDYLLARADASVPKTAELSHQTLVLLNPPFDTFGIFFPLYRAWHGTPRPQRFRWLSTGVSDLVVTRLDERSLKVAPRAGFLANSSQLVLRSLDDPMRIGERVVLSDMSIEVVALTDDARPAEIVVRFDHTLESATYRWMHWGKHGYLPFVLPAVGQSVLIPAVDMRTALTVGH